MARRRYISPGFWESATAARLSPGSRLLLIGCWTLADDEGLLEWSAALLKELLYSADPEVDEEHVAAWMAELVQTDVVLPYRGGKSQIPCGYIMGFERLHPTARPKPSTLPPPNWKNNRIAAAYMRRDGHRCHLCGGPIFYSGDGPSGWSVLGYELCESPDHLVPRSDGGHDYPSNIRTAHLTCNKARCNRPVEQARQARRVQEVSELSRQMYQKKYNRPFDEQGSGAPVTPAPTSRSAPKPAHSGSADLMEPNTARLTTDSLSDAMHDSSPAHDTLSESRSRTAIVPLTCENADSPQPHDNLSESVMSVPASLTTDSLLERERERELEGDQDPLSASRSCTASGGAAAAEAAAIFDDPTEVAAPRRDQQASAFGAGNDKQPQVEDGGQGHDPVRSPVHSPVHSPVAGAVSDRASSTGTGTSVGGGSVDGPDLSGADVVLDEEPARTQPPLSVEAAVVAGTAEAGEDPMSVENQESLFVVAPDMVAELDDDGPEPLNWTPQRKERAHAILKPWWATYGAGWPQTYRTVFKAVMSALCKNAAQAHVRARLDALGEAGEHVTNAALAPPKRKAPESHTEERRAQAHAILRPWWANYGEGWAQSYPVVFKVLVTTLANGVPAEDVKRALEVLGPQRKPISGGTIGFALARSSRQVSEEQVFAEAAASRSADKYTQRTM